MNPLFGTDFYKVSHKKMYPEGTTKIYSNLTPRKSRKDGVQSVVVFGIQYMVIKYIIEEWNNNFFVKTHTVDDKKRIIGDYTRMIGSTLGPNAVDTTHIEKLWYLGYMPLEIKALPEGTLCPIGVPCMTITNTVDHAYWLVNYLETIMSCTIWQPITSATIANEYKKLLTRFALETTGSVDFVNWQGHDFSMRGMSSFESACTSGAGHLLSFTGTDTIPAIAFLEKYYGADVTKELVGASVPATEHSVMCMGTKDDEIGTFKRLLDQYPTGILSVVSDTWDLWKVCTEFLPTLKDQILAREGKLVIRPDSGDPVDIICGLTGKPGHAVIERDGETRLKNYENSITKPVSLAEVKGLVEILWDTFGGTIVKGNDGNEYKVLDSHIGAIYGDAITLERAEEICERLKAKGFASTNIVLGIGSYTYQYNTRDTFGFAIKATYGEVEEDNGEELVSVGRAIFKDPITDDGTKKSKKGLLRVGKGDDSFLRVEDECTTEEAEGGELQTVFKDGKLYNQVTLSEIRARLASQI